MARLWNDAGRRPASHMKKAVKLGPLFQTLRLRNYLQAGHQNFLNFKSGIIRSNLRLILFTGGRPAPSARTGFLGKQKAVNGAT